MIQKEGTTTITELEQEEFHVTCVMHNTRTSQRMIEYNVKKGKPEYLSIDEETKLIETYCSSRYSKTGHLEGKGYALPLCHTCCRT
jgi:hypothetical protein